MRRARVYALAAAIIIAAAAVAFVATASSSAQGPPAWLVSQAQQVAAGNDDPAPTSAAYCLTTMRAAAPAVGLTSDTAADPTLQVYLVVLTGHFTDVNAFYPTGGSPPKGTTIAFTVDVRTRAIHDFGMSNGQADTTGVGQVTSFTLPAGDPTPTPQATAGSPGVSHPLPVASRPYVGPKSHRLTVVAAKWVVQWGGGGNTRVVVVPTKLSRASSVFGPVIYGQGYRKSFALFASGTFTSPVSHQQCHFIAAEVDTATLRVLGETWAPAGWSIGSLGRPYSLSLW